MTGIIKLVLVSAVMLVIYGVFAYFSRIEYLNDLIERIKNRGKVHAE